MPETLEVTLKISWIWMKFSGKIKPHFETTIKCVSFKKMTWFCIVYPPNKFNNQTTIMSLNFTPHYFNFLSTNWVPNFWTEKSVPSCFLSVWKPNMGSFNILMNSHTVDGKIYKVCKKGCMFILILKSGFPKYRFTFFHVTAHSEPIHTASDKLVECHSAY